MGNRVGSLIVLLVLGGIVAAAVLLVLRFAGDSETQPAVFVSLAADQPVLLGEPLEIEVRAQGSNPISILTLLVDGTIITQATPIFDPDQGRYAAVLFWTPQTLGFASLRIVATDTTGSQTEITRRVDVTDDAERVERAREAARGGQPQQTAPAQPPPPTTADGESEAADEQGVPAAPPTAVQDGGAARILSPQDGERYEFGSAAPLTVEIETTGTGPLSSVLVYVTPVLADGSFGRSQLAFAANPDVAATAGVYRETVRGVEEWFPRNGAYDLQLVALTPDQRRFEDFIRITVTGVADSEQQSADASDQEADGDQAAEGGDAEDEELPDLEIVTVRETENGISVTVINNGVGPAQQVEVELSVIRIRDASELASTRARVTLAPGQRANVPIEISVSEVTETLVALRAQDDADTSNNTYELTLSATESAPDDGLLEEEQQTSEAQDDTLQQQEAQEPAEPPPAEQPDLAFLEARFTDDGIALLRVINAGDAPSGDFTIRITDAAGELLETITRGTDSPLAPGEGEILAGRVAHSGSVVITLDPDNLTAESNESNNVIRLEVGG